MAPWLGYYYVVGPYGDYLDAVSPWTDWAHVHTANSLALPATQTLAARCQAAGVKVCYSVTPLLWIPQTAPLPYVLHPDWKARFNAQRAWYDAFQDRGILHSLYLADEPTANGVPEADIRMVCDYMRAETSYKTMIVQEACCEILPVPAVDYYGIVAYTPKTMSQVRNAYLQRPEANVLVVQAFNEKPNPIPDQWAWYAIWDEVVASRPGAGMALFTYPSYAQGPPGPTQKHYIGSIEDHGVRAVHVQIAERLAGEEEG